MASSASSMAESTPSTPSKAAPLTPRSKIKAMMAALDDSDGEDAITKSVEGMERDKEQLTPRTRVKNMLAKLDEGDAKHQLKEPGEMNGAGDIEDGEDELEDKEDEDVVVAPKGRLAARMQAQNQVELPTEAESKTPMMTSTYRTVREQLSRSPEDTQASQQESSPTDAQGDEKVGGMTKRFLTRRKPPSSKNLQGEAQNEHEEPAGVTKRFLAEKKTTAAESVGNSSPSVTPIKQKALPKSSVTPELPQSGGATPQHDHVSGLFLTPTPTRTSKAKEGSHDEDSDSELPHDPLANPRFLALVAKKRAERQARAAEEEKKRSEIYARLEGQSKKISSRNRAASAEFSEDTEDDAVIDKKLTQQGRPTRKASKKALEEMNRETQRMARNLQLAHQAKTKKKITKDSLLARFNFTSNKIAAATIAMANSSSTIGSPAPVSDDDNIKEHSTPPTSPLRTESNISEILPRKMDNLSQIEAVEELSQMYTDDELSQMEGIFPQPIPRNGKGKGVDKSLLNSTIAKEQGKARKIAKPSIRVRPPPRPITSKEQALDSDSDLEIISSEKKTGYKSKKLAIFDCLPAQKATETPGLQTLRALAQLESPSKLKSKTKSKMTSREMQVSLQQRARQQAAKERSDKIQELKDRGITIQTAEERERTQLEVEDMLEKARREGDDLAKKEKKQAKKERLENGDVNALDDSSDEDEDYGGADIDLSGSEEDEQEVEEDAEIADEEMSEGDDGNEGGVILDDGNDLIDGEASETEDDNADSMIDDDDAEINLRVTLHNKRRAHVNRIVVDEDDEDVEMRSTNPNGSLPPKVPFIPKLGNSSNSAFMGLSQAFAATMAESQTQRDNENIDEEQDSLMFLRGMPEPDFPMMDIAENDSFVPNSQPNLGAVVDLHLSQFGTDPADPRPESQPAMTQMPWDPTPDQGFQITPAPRRFVSPPPTAPPSTIDTVVTNLASDETVVKKKGKLRRGTEMNAHSTQAEDSFPGGNSSSEATNVLNISAFDVLKRGAKQKTLAEEFNKKESKAKDMVEEQAEESEDEYQGLGGASDDGSGDEEDGEVLKMIDEADVDVNERELAAFHAGKERDDEEKVIQKLYKDINSGALRRKRGAGVNSDLDDSSDEERRKVEFKRAKHAREMKALLNNSDVAKIADDKKKSAFLRTIEDRNDDDGIDFLDDEGPSHPDIVVPDSQVLDPQDSPALLNLETGAVEVVGAKRKRPLQESVADTINRTRPPNPRRVHNNLKKPASFAETRKYISELVEGVDYVAETFIAGSDSEAEFEDHDNLFDFADSAAGNPSSQPMTNVQSATATTTHPRRSINSIIDRLSLKRADSGSSNSDTHTGRLAFHNPATASTLTSKVPSLLRRATTQVTDYNAQHGITIAPDRPSGNGKDVLRKGGSKKSSVNYFAREEERRRALGSRGEGLGEGKAWMKIAGVGARGLGGLGGGSWE